MKFKTLKIMIPSIALLMTSGCTVIGEEEFDCPNPEKGVCLNAQTAYEFAEDSEKVRGYEKYNKSFDQKKVNEDDEDDDSSLAKNTLRDIAPVAGTLSKPLYQPKPVIMPAKVLRAWVNIYEDASGVLHMPQTSYVEITPRKWALGGGIKSTSFKTSPPFSVVK